ncbi:YSIRK-type signal peptide-containing protein [Staphylococcus pseudoxylosus]|uniref:GA-like domain-containing protein n=1 Tax=Staphylococcus pseudoxylosus TaxID=2282419 RepID=UPI001F183B5C|nr:YSIRK-type signal peptide-containing protein [Staphylococcus pseudoxylosus]MCE5000797.1 YSIRK-type signal peptide-containing protein [Staphylococcus pseudoxylosus]
MRVLAEYIARRNNKYSIRKFTIGTASVLLGSVLFINQDSEAAADMVNDKESIAAQNNAEAQVISEAKQFDLEEVAEKHSKETQIDENNSNVVNQKLSKSKETNQTTQEDEQNALKNEVKVEEGQRQSEISNKVDESTNYNFEKEQIKKQENKITEQNKTTISSHEKSSNTNRDNDNSIPIEEKQSTVEKKVENANQIKNNGVEEQKFVDDGEQNKVPVVTQKIESNNDINQSNSLNVIDLNNETKESDKNKPKSRVARSLNRLPYNSRFSYRRYSQRLNYDTVQSGDYILTAIREVERNRDELTEEERKLFMRNIIRQTSLKNNKSVYNNVFRGIYSVLGNRKINAAQADKINELLFKMKDLTFNRDNNDYRAVYTFTNQSDVTKNHFGIVEDEIFYNDGEVLIATMVLSKEKGRGTYRFENYGIRPNASLSKKIKKVFAVYNGRQRVLLQQDHLGYYSYTRPDSGSNGNPNTGGGSGGSVEFVISFDASYYIDVKKDKLFGYILSDTLDPNVLRGVNITNQSVDIDDVARRINGALVKAKKQKAEEAIQSAEQAQQYAEQQLAEVTADGAVSPAEKQKVDEAITALEEAKQIAIAKLGTVLEGAAGKEDLQGRIDGIPTLTSPEVNDLDSNGVIDTVQLAEAAQAVQAAEEAKRTLDQKLEEATRDSLINPDEQATINQLNQAFKVAKSAASNKIKNVPDGTKGKNTLQNKLDQMNEVTVPEINDQDSNGVLDTEQLSQADQAVQSAEQAQRAVTQKLSEVNSDGLITPDEKAEIDRLNQALETAKTTASEKIDNVPEGMPGKSDLQTRLAKITTVVSPEVNDRDSNGVRDDQQISEIAQALIALEATKIIDDQKLAAVLSDGLVTPSEKEEIDKLNKVLSMLKEELLEKVNELPDSMLDKAQFQQNINRITSVISPEVNDRDSNGVLDTVQLSEAERAIIAAKEAKRAADNKLSEATADGLINPTEKGELDQLIEALETAKTNASEKLTNVPNGMTGKADLQTRLEGIGTVTSPEVNDRDSNGVKDTVQLSYAEQTIVLAEEAKRAVDNKLTEITGDGLVNPSEKADLDRLIEVLDKAKADASTKLNNVPDGTAGKADLQTRLEGIGTVTVPEVNDRDGNGVLDTVQLSEAEQAIVSAEEAKRAVDNKLSEVIADGLINPTEKGDLDQLIEALETAKTNATEKLNNVPDGTAGKADLQTRLDRIGAVTAPEVNDRDSNGVLDTVQLSEAEQAIALAEEAKRAVDNKLSEITGDGLINPTEKAELDRLIEALETTKINATEKLINVPDGTAGKVDLQTRLEGIGTVTSPEVNDRDSNGVLDTEQLTDAEQAIALAEEAKRAADNKLSEVTADGLINPTDKAELGRLIEVLDEAKADASTKLNNVPDGTVGKDGLQTRLEGIGTVTAPEVNDQDSNGVLDTEQLSEAEQAIVSAEEAKRAVDNKLSEITEDVLINPTEKADLDRLIEALESAKSNATEKLNNVPNGTAGKDALETRLDQIGTVTVPKVNDQDSNGVLDTEQLAEANKAIQAVEQAKAKVEGKLAEIKKDGLITPSEKVKVDKLIEALQKAKVSAINIIKKLPNSDIDINALQNKLEQITLVTPPKVNDKDGNGILDIESPNTKGQNHANVNKHLDKTIRKLNSQKSMNNNVKIQNSNERDNMLLDESPHIGLYRHNSEAQQLNVISSYLQIMENETNGNSENNMNSITHLPDAGGESKDSWIFGTLLGAIGSMMLLRKRQEKKKGTEKITKI